VVSDAFSSVFVCVSCSVLRARVCTRNETTDSVCSPGGGVSWGPGGPLLASASAGLAGDLNFLWCEPTSPPPPPFCSSDRLLPLLYSHRPRSLFSPLTYISCTGGTISSPSSSSSSSPSRFLRPRCTRHDYIWRFPDFEIGAVDPSFSPREPALLRSRRNDFKSVRNDILVFYERRAMPPRVQASPENYYRMYSVIYGPPPPRFIIAVTTRVDGDFLQNRFEPTALQTSHRRLSAAAFCIFSTRCNAQFGSNETVEKPEVEAPRPWIRAQPSPYFLVQYNNIIILIGFTRQLYILYTSVCDPCNRSPRRLRRMRLIT